jgi:hypothetical protein
MCHVQKLDKIPEGLMLGCKEQGISHGNGADGVVGEAAFLGE